MSLTFIRSGSYRVLNVHTSISNWVTYFLTDFRIPFTYCLFPSVFVIDVEKVVEVYPPDIMDGHKIKKRNYVLYIQR